MVYFPSPLRLPMQTASDSVPTLSKFSLSSRGNLAALPHYLLLIAALAVLLAPALWNGYALIFYDTGGYIEAAREMYLVPGRSLFYGLFLRIASLGWTSLWGPAVLQAGLSLWLIHLLWRAHRLPSGPAMLLPVATVMAAATSLAWYADQLMPDIFVPLVVLALWLLSAHGPILSRREKVGLSLLVLLGLLSHMSCLALALGLAVVLLVQRLFIASWPLRLRIVLPTMLVVAVLALMPLLHTLLTGHGGFTPGGSAFLFGRLVQDGVAKRWLQEHCPVPGVRLCAWKDQLPQTADDFLWGMDSPYKKIGDWQDIQVQREMGQLIREMVRAYPGMILSTGLGSTLEQIISVATGDDLDAKHWDSRGIISTFLPRISPAFNSARQQREQITPELLARWNRLHVPVALASMLLLLPIARWGLRSNHRPLAGLALFVLVALLGNAFICGALSNPHHRYQSRLIWLAPLVVVLALGEYFADRRDRSRQLPISAD